MARAALYNNYCEIYSCSWEGLEYGNVNRSYKHLRSTRCGVDNRPGSKTTENGEVVFDYSKTFYMRYYVPVLEGYMIKYQDKFYEVLSIVKDTFKGEMILECSLAKDIDLE